MVVVVVAVVVEVVVAVAVAVAVTVAGDSLAASAFLALLRKVLDNGLSGAVTASLGFDDGTFGEETLPVAAVGGNRGGGNGRLWSCTRTDWTIC